MSSKKIITDITNINTRILVKNCLDVLHRHYPGHPWLVMADDVGGIVNIMHPQLSGLHGFTLHITKIDTKFKSVSRGAGELLERFKVKRGGHKQDEIQMLDTNIKGNRIHCE